MKKDKTYIELEENSMVKKANTAYNISSNSHLAMEVNNPVNLTFNYLRRSIDILGLNFTKPFNQVKDHIDFIGCIREGLPKRALDKLKEVAGFSTTEVAEIIHTSDRTIRRYTPSHKLDSEQSERVIEIAKLYSRGEEVFGSLEEFKEWMNSNVMALGNVKPKSFLDTSMGIEMLMDEIGRIEHGIFA